jgi:hypothetical protein
MPPMPVLVYCLVVDEAEEKLETDIMVVEGQS